MENRLLGEKDFIKSDEYRSRVHGFIPGGAHTYSKGDDQFPQLAPAAIARGKGGRVWDLDGNVFVDCSLGLGAVSLGHAYEPVLKAVRKQLELGAAFQRPASIELELARELVESISGADRVKFAKNGSAITTAAVKLARAYTNRDIVAFPGNHPFYSYDDWFIGKTLCNSGVPDAVKPLSVTYDSTKPESLARLFAEYPERIACVITEPEELIPQDPSILISIGQICREHGALFILDEMVTGYRAGWPGAHNKLNIDADLITWGKAIGNGFSFCALTGRADIMDLGGIRDSRAPKVFLISTTHGGEAHAIAAAQAVLKEYKEKNVLEYHKKLVDSVAQRMEDAVAISGLSKYIGIHKSEWRIVCVFKGENGAFSPALRTLFMQEMIRRGVLFQGLFLPCYSHTEEDVEVIGNSFKSSCEVYKRGLEDGVGQLLIGSIIPPVFRKYNKCLQICPAQPCPYESDCKK